MKSVGWQLLIKDIHVRLVYPNEGTSKFGTWRICGSGNLINGNDSYLEFSSSPVIHMLNKATENKWGIVDFEKLKQEVDKAFDRYESYLKIV